MLLFRLSSLIELSWGGGRSGGGVMGPLLLWLAGEEGWGGGEGEAEGERGEVGRAGGPGGRGRLRNICSWFGEEVGEGASAGGASPSPSLSDSSGDILKSPSS